MKSVGTGVTDQLALLVKRASEDRDESALREIYDLYVKYLTAVCSRYVPDPSDLKDVLQESFIRIFSSLGSFEYRGGDSFRFWLRRIAVNESVSFLRRKKRVSFIVFGSDPADDVPDEDITAEGIPPSVLQRMIKELPPGYRTVFSLYVFERKSHKEIAGMLGITEKASASQLSRARARLVEKIKEYRRGYER